MDIKRIGAIAVALVISGCTSWHTRLSRDLDSLVGAPVNVAVIRLGHPTSERNSLGDHMAVWEYEGSMPGFGGAQLHANCTIQLTLDDKKVITGTEWNGNLAGCQRYANALK